MIHYAKNKQFWHEITYVNLTCVSGNELVHITDTLDGDFTLTEHGIVVGVGGDQKSIWNINTCFTVTLLTCSTLTFFGGIF